MTLFRDFLVVDIGRVSYKYSSSCRGYNTETKAHVRLQDIFALPHEKSIGQFEPSNPVRWRSDMCLSYKYGMNNNWLITLITSQRKARGSWCTLKTARAVPINCQTARSAEHFDLYFAYKYSTLRLDSSNIGLNKVLRSDRHRDWYIPQWSLESVVTATILELFGDAFIKLKKRTYSLAMSVCPLALNMSVPTGRIFMKFGI